MEIVFVWGDQERGGEPTGGRERVRERVREGGAAPSGTLKANPLPFAGLQRLVPLKGGIKAAVGEGGWGVGCKKDRGCLLSLLPRLLEQEHPPVRER